VKYVKICSKFFDYVCIHWCLQGGLYKGGCTSSRFSTFQTLNKNPCARGVVRHPLYNTRCTRKCMSPYCVNVSRGLPTTPIVQHPLYKGVCTSSRFLTPQTLNRNPCTRGVVQGWLYNPPCTMGVVSWVFNRLLRGQKVGF